MIKSNDITVIIPAYNAEKYLAEAIESIRCQTLGSDAEIIVIDDGSSDGTVEVAIKCNTVLLRQEHGWAAAARNAGIKKAEKEWLFFLDADDVAEKDALEQYAKAIEKESDAVAMFSMAEDFISPELMEDEKSRLHPRTTAYQGAFGGVVFIRRAAFSEVGFLDEKLTSGEGVDWLLRFRASGLKGITLPVTTVRRRLHTSNTGRIMKVDEGKNYAAILRHIMKEKTS